jgi:hypothetical protein
MKFRLSAQASRELTRAVWETLPGLKLRQPGGVANRPAGGGCGITTYATLTRQNLASLSHQV